MNKGATMETISKPAYLVALQEAFSKTHSEDVTPLCRWMGIPTPDECPTPGQARAWTKDDWGKWAEQNNYEYAGDTTHSWMWRHKVVNKLTINAAKTSGDWRAPMRLAADVRRMVRSFATAANAIMHAMVASNVPSTFFTRSEKEIRDDLIIQASSRNAEGFVGDLIHNSMVANTRKNTTNCKTVGQLLTLLSKFDSPRKVLADIMGSEHAEREWTALKTADPSYPTSLEIYEEVKDQLDLLRDTEQAEKEQKRAEREAKEAEIEARKAEKNRPRTSQELAQTQVDTVHSANLKTLDGVMQAAEAAMRTAGSVLDRARLARQSLAKATLTGIEDTGPLKADLAATRQENDSLRQSQAESLAKVEALLLQVDELKAKQVDSEVVRKLQEDKVALVAVASLIIDSVVAAQKAGPFEMVNILTSLSNDAKEVLKHHG
jgi:hypothetical protein